MAKKDYESRTEALIQPMIDEHHFELVDVEYVKEAGYRVDLSEGRKHHEIYLSDPRRTAPERLKTVIRQPVCRKDG